MKERNMNRDKKNVVQEMIKQMSLSEKIAQLSYNAPSIERLGLKGYCYWNEGLHGVARAGIASVFPQAIALAATFDSELMVRIGTAIGKEARAKYNVSLNYSDSKIYQGLHIWSPNINIFRDPRWGRGQETYGEDPYLTSVMATSYVCGVQKKIGGIPLADCGIKHFAVHSGPESLRHGFNSIVGKKDFYETYTRAFEYVIKNAAPGGVMGAYNAINGEPCCSGKFLEEVVRERFGHKGYIVSDYLSVEDIYENHKKAKSVFDAGVQAFNAGCDMNCGNAYADLEVAVKDGSIEEKRIDLSLNRILSTRFELGMFDKNCPLNSIGYDVVNCKAHQRLNLRAARESVVLLKNNGILPLDLSKYKSIAVVGNNADNVSAMVGNYNGTAYLPNTFLREIDRLCKKRNVKIQYARGCFATNNMQAWTEQPLREAVEVCKDADVIILVLGLDNTIEGEEGDVKTTSAGDNITLSYSESQQELIDSACALGKPVILVNVSGSPIILNEGKFDAILQQFYGGQFAGKALADVLTGKVSPCGKLPISFYKSAADLPPFEDYSMKNRTYRYAGTNIQYPFGYGLSYSTFSIVSTEYMNKKMKVEIINDGNMDGRETIQIYMKCSENFETPLYELVGFNKVFLKRGQRKVVNVSLNDLFVFDANGEKKKPTIGRSSLIVATSHPDFSPTKKIIRI